jgi:vacuolar protein sorting-associated protein VTA1
MNIWGEPEAEIHSKILYAKWNAARIIKAIKEGNDPNESNPRPKPAVPEDNLPSLEPHNPDVQKMGVQPVKPWQASVEEDPNERYEVEPAQYNDAPPNPWAQHPVHPLSNVRLATSHEQAEGGYFPEVPITNITAETQSSKLPTGPPEPPEDTIGLQRRVPSRTPTSFLSKSSDELPAPPQNMYGPPHVPQQPIYRETPSPMFPAPTPIKPPRQQTYVIDDVAMAKAQKHARWAISALNFEDVNTAVQELQEALRTLGAS